MFSIVFNFAFGIFAVAFALHFAVKREWISMGVLVVIAYVIFGFLVFIEAPVELGQGHVPKVVEKYTKRLDIGVAYQLIASEKEGDGYILMMRKTGTSEFNCSRVEGPIPSSNFTLVDGKPVTIDAPVPTVGVK